MKRVAVLTAALALTGCAPLHIAPITTLASQTTAGTPTGPGSETAANGQADTGSQAAESSQADTSSQAAPSNPAAAGGQPGAGVAQANATHEYPSPLPPPQTAARASANPTAAVRAFATDYINWTARSLAADMTALSHRSVGQARSATALAAAEAARDYELQRGGVANSGIVEALAPLPRHAHQYVVVTRERTTATNTDAYQGLEPAWHVALATVTQLTPGNWVVSAWAPQS